MEENVKRELAENEVLINDEIVTISEEDRYGNTEVIGEEPKVGDPIVITGSDDVISGIGHFGGWGVDVKRESEGFNVKYYSGVIFCEENMFMGYGVYGQKLYKTPELVIAEQPYQKWIYTAENGLQPNPNYKEPSPEENIPPETLKALEEKWMSDLIKEVSTETTEVTE